MSCYNADITVSLLTVFKITTSSPAYPSASEVFYGRPKLNGYIDVILFGI